MRIRPVTPQDEDFLYDLYASTRCEELANWGWDEQATDTFLRMQWTAQSYSYRMQFPNLEQRLVTVQEQEAGRLLTCLTGDALLLVDISLLPRYRGQGYGTRLIALVKEEAERYGVPVRLTVRRDNRAKRLYERLGFKAFDDNGMDIRMEWGTA